MSPVAWLWWLNSRVHSHGMAAGMIAGEDQCPRVRLDRCIPQGGQLWKPAFRSHKLNRSVN